MGKTHPFCGVASRRLNEGRPTLLLLGQDFDIRNMLSQFARSSNSTGRSRPAIACFAASAEASRHLGLRHPTSVPAAHSPPRQTRPPTPNTIDTVIGKAIAELELTHRVRHERAGRATAGGQPGLWTR